MVEKIDIQKEYEELEQLIKKGDHSQALIQSNKIILAFPNEIEAVKSKIIAFINLSKYKDLINYIEASKLQGTYLLEYSYALYENKDYKQSIDFLQKAKSSSPSLINSIDILIAQIYHKQGLFVNSYSIYKDILNRKKDNLDLETDLITNYLAAYSLSKANDNEYLKEISRHLNTWESFYNFALIKLRSGQYADYFEISFRMKKNYPKQEDEFNELKEIHLNLHIVQKTLDGFEFGKATTVLSDYDTLLKKGIKYPDLMPYFFNNLLQIKKDKETPNETIKKLEGFLNNESLNKEEKGILLRNKFNYLIRANKIPQATELLSSAFDENDPEWLIAKTFLYYKSEKEKFVDLFFKDSALISKPEPNLYAIQIMLASIGTKSFEIVHNRILSFVKQFNTFSFNVHFISFFIGLYQVRRLKDYLKEFIMNYKDPIEISKRIPDQSLLKLIIPKLAQEFYSLGLYNESISFYNFYLDKIDSNNRNVKLLLIESLSHLDISKCDQIRQKIDETMIDLSNEHMNSLLNELFIKFKKPTQKKEKKKVKKKKKIRYPKNYDPKNPGPMPDPERWLPKLQKKKYRAKSKLAYQGANADNKTTTAKYAK